jgi:hypothetical protein
VEEVGEFLAATLSAARTQPPAFATERHQVFGPTVLADYPHEAVGQDATFQEAAQNTVHDRSPIPVAAGITILIDVDEPLQVVGDDAVQRCLVRTPGLITW